MMFIHLERSVFMFYFTVANELETLRQTKLDLEAIVREKTQVWTFCSMFC